MAKSKVTKTGDWKKVAKIIGSLQKTFEKVRRAHLTWISEEAVTIIKDHINAQDLSWEALSPAYKKAKEAGGFDTDIYKKTGRFAESIVGELVGRDSVFIGIKHGARGSNGEDLANIATILEYGAQGANIPARPLWLPSMGEVLELWDKNPPPAADVKKELDGK